MTENNPRQSTALAVENKGLNDHVAAATSAYLQNRVVELQVRVMELEEQVAELTPEPETPDPLLTDGPELPDVESEVA